MRWILVDFPGAEFDCSLVVLLACWYQESSAEVNPKSMRVRLAEFLYDQGGAEGEQHKADTLPCQGLFQRGEKTEARKSEVKGIVVKSGRYSCTQKILMWW
jgi:hypothetical protein